MSKVKRILFITIACLVSFFIVELVSFFIMWQNSHTKDYVANRHYFQIRAMLMGKDDPMLRPKYMSLPYLGYIPYPGFERNKILQHNEDGYRGEKVPFEKSNKFRILCLGGSTTYGSGVENPNQTYPAHLKEILNQKLHENKQITTAYKGVEVINAGIEAGNSAEELQQYLFKYRYYFPNVVVIHSGINDALQMMIADQDFQLDYTDFRRLNFNIEMLKEPARFLMNSYFISLVVIKFGYGNFSDFHENEFKRQQEQRFCHWSNVNVDSVYSSRDYLRYPFYRNMKTLYNQILQDSSRLIVMPNEAINKGNISNPAYFKWNDFNKEVSYKLATECKTAAIGYIPFSKSQIPDSLWIDDCHLKSEGEYLKAKLVANYIWDSMFHGYSNLKEERLFKH